MKLDYQASSLVILGDWNPNIVKDVWIRKNLLEHDNEQVNMGLKNTGATAIGNLATIPAAVFRNIGFAVAGERLELSLIHSNDFGHIEDCVYRLHKAQSSTLVSGYGVNLVYIQNMVNNDLINLFGANPLSQESFNQSHTFVLNLENIRTNIRVEINKANNKSAIAFNFHFDVGDFDTLIQYMTEYPINDLNQKAICFISSYCDLRLES